MLIKVVFSVLIGLVILSLLIFGAIEEENERQKKIELIEELQRQCRERLTPKFSLSDCLKRMEQAGIEVMKEREKQPKYVITLWAGLDGLQINDDGTTEWVRRFEEPKLPKSVAQYDVYSMVNTCASPDVQLLQRQLQASCIQASMTYQNQLLISALQSSPCPSYPRYPYNSVLYTHPYCNSPTYFSFDGCQNTTF